MGSFVVLYAYKRQLSNSKHRKTKMARITLIFLGVFLIQVVSSKEESGGITFSGDAQESVEGDVDTRNDTISDEDVDTRFINLPGFDLNAFAGQVAGSALGTVIGNAGVQFASGILNCRGRGKRSI